MRGVVQLGPVESGEVEEPAEVERSREAEDLLFGHVELTHQEAERHVVHVVGDLEPDGRTEPAPQELLLERLDEVLGLVLLDLDVFVAGDAEHVVLHDLHAGEEVAEVVRDEVFEGDVARVLDRLAGVDAHEARQHLRNLDAGELLAAGAAVPHAHREVEGEARDVGERMRRVDRERHEHREDLPREVAAQVLALALAELRPRHDPDAGLGEGRLHELLVDDRVPLLQLVRLPRDVAQHVERCATDIRRHGESGDDAALQAGDPHHEELVEVRGEDREEVRSLEHRDAWILGELEHALVEGEPAQLAVEIAFGGQLRRALDVEGLEVVVEVAGGAVFVEGGVGHPLIMPFGWATGMGLR